MEPTFSKGTAQALIDAGWKPSEVAEYLMVDIAVVLAATHAPKPRRHYDNEWNKDEPPIMHHNELI